MAVQILPSEFGMSPERLAAMMKDSWQPLDTLGDNKLAIAKIQNEQNFQRERDASIFSNRAEQAKLDEQLREQGAAKAEQLKSRLNLEQQARTYRVPVVNGDGKPRTEDDIINDIQAKALKAAKSVKSALDTTNAKIDAQLKDLYNYKPNVAEQQQAAARLIAGDKELGAKLGPDGMQKLRDSITTPDGLSKFLYDLNHGVHFHWMRDPQWATDINLKFGDALQKVQDIDQQNYAANAQVKQKALLEEKGRIVGPLAAEFARHYANVATDDQPSLLKENEPPPASAADPDAAFKALLNKKPTPAPAAPASTQVPVPEGTPDKYNPNKYLAIAQDENSKAADDQKSNAIQQLKDRRDSIAAHIESLDSDEPMYGNGGIPILSGLFGGGSKELSRGEKAQIQAELSKQKLQLDQQIQQLESPAPQTPVQAPSNITPQPQPSASIDPAHKQLGDLANQLAQRDGIPMEHIKAIVSASQNPQDPGYAPAKQLVQGYLARAQQMLSQADNTTNAFRATAQPQSDDQPEEQPA